MTRTSVAAYRIVAVGLLCLGIAAATYGALRVTLGPAPVFIHIRWAPEVDDFEKRVAERRYRLSNGEQLEGRTWGYTLNDVSAANIKALVSDAFVEDTQDIDRTVFQVTPSAERRPYPTSDSLVPMSLWGASVLCLLIGVSATSVGLMQRASGDLAIVPYPEPSAMSRRLTVKQWVALLVVVAALGGCFLWSRTMELRVDEENHLAQIDRYASGDFATTTGTVGGFHAAAATFKWTTGFSRKEGMRLFVLLISGATILVFFALARSFYPRAAVVRTLQFVFFPLLFPFWFLIYTDVYALMFLLLAVQALARDRFHAAGILMILSVTARQTYVVWMALLGLWTGIVNAAGPLARLIKRSLSFAAGAALFLLFVIANDGVAVADRNSHPDMELQTENLLFMLVCFWLMFLPLVVVKLPQIARLHPALLAGVPLVSLVLFFGTFEVDHPWNAKWQENFLRNAMLDTMTSSTNAGLVTSIAIALAVLSLCVIRLRQPAHYLIYPFAALSVMPVWLIEQRYYIPAFALFMLFREPAPPWVERTILAMNGIISAWLFEGIVNGRVFL